jgi:hypothetical protein
MTFAQTRIPSLPVIRSAAACALIIFVVIAILPL